MIREKANLCTIVRPISRLLLLLALSFPIISVYCSGSYLSLHFYYIHYRL
jgi:hypothetical protein